MSITELSVKRPAAMVMFLILMIALGVMGYTNMGADLLPSMNIPVITISTTYAGAGAEEIKKDIVKPIEDAVAGISGIDTIQSSARESYGMVIIQFTMETDMNTAFTDVQKAVETVSAKLPTNANKPVLYKLDLNQSAVLTLSVTGDVPYEELYNQADNTKARIEKVPGIGKVELQGGKEKELTVKVDKSAMEYYGVNINTLLGKLRADNTNMPAGQIEEERSYQSVKVVGEFEDISAVRNLLIPTTGGGSIRLADIAEVSLQYPADKQVIKLNGKNTIGINIQKQSDANVVSAVKSVKKELKSIEKSLPEGIHITIADDTTTFINSALRGIQDNVVEGIITTAIVLFLFLRSWRSSLIVLIAIPTSLVSTFFLTNLFGFTLNMMSLMGLSLCIGILVDDSIVVLENIQRHLGMGKNPVIAAIEGRKEIGLAAIAITLCDIVVFVPIAFTSGMSGQMFKEFGLTVAFASLFSLLISFTVTPMLSSRILKKEAEHREKKEGVKQGRSSRIFESMLETYRKFLIWSLDNRKKVIALILLMFVGSIALIPAGLVKMEFIPQSDQSRLSLSVDLTPGSTLKMTEQKVTQVEEYLKTIREVKDFYTTIGTNNNKASASIIVKLVDKKERKKSQSQIAAEVRKWGKNLTGTDFIVSESQVGMGSTKPISIDILGQDMTVLKEIAEKVEETVRSVPGITDVGNSTKVRESEVQIRVDRLAAAQYGVSVSDVSTVLRTAIQGTPAGVYRQNGDEYDIMVKYMDDQVKNIADIGSIRISTTTGQPTFLNQVASIVQADSQQQISRKDRQDVATISANIQGVVLGEVTKEINQKLAGLKPPNGYSISTGGTQKQMADAFVSLGKALAASIILVYMILVVLYESFLTPVIRMLALPVAIVGAIVSLAATGNSMNMMSMIGLIMLDGLASKNGTLLIDYTNTLMKKGMPLREALIEAGTTRLRPIIMTSLTMIVGMMPAALSLGEGAEMKAGMAIIIIGGMIASTVLSPILLPVVYTLIDDAKRKTSRKRGKSSDIVEVPKYEV